MHRKYLHRAAFSILVASGTLTAGLGSSHVATDRIEPPPYRVSVNLRQHGGGVPHDFLCAAGTSAPCGGTIAVRNEAPITATFTFGPNTVIAKFMRQGVALDDHGNAWIRVRLGSEGSGRESVALFYPISLSTYQATGGQWMSQRTTTAAYDRADITVERVTP